jgi:hypothetical protein
VYHPTISEYRVLATSHITRNKLRQYKVIPTDIAMPTDRWMPPEVYTDQWLDGTVLDGLKK